MGDRRGIERGWWCYDALGLLPCSPSPLSSAVKKALYTNQADFLTLNSYKGSSMRWEGATLIRTQQNVQMGRCPGHFATDIRSGMRSLEPLPSPTGRR